MSAIRQDGKSAAAFRTISEVSDELDVPQHVLRFWETKFSQVRPLKRGGGRRYYRPEDVQLLRSIRDLLYRDGYTIKGVQKLLREGGRAALAAPGRQEPHPELQLDLGERPGAPANDAASAEADEAEGSVRDDLGEILNELKSLQLLLRNALGR